MGLALVLVLTMISPMRVEALGLPPRPGRPSPARDMSGPKTSRLQEVAPPALVQELREALAEHEPQVRILAPSDGSLMADGPWRLRLAVEDWPLLDAGPLGLGPHLVAQLDDQPPLPLTSTDSEMPALSPGSHRLTVYAARPWGEAVKSPGAYRQIRLHRLAANPLTIPAPGSPQLIAVAPQTVPQHEPVLLDWLLLDAPLQKLRGTESDGWRLRVSVNGDSFLVDEQTPLWLSGWRSGENALQLELVDGRGEPLNPPFNALVKSVMVSAQAPPSPWQMASLSSRERALLLGVPSPEQEHVQEAAPEPARTTPDAKPAEPAAGAPPPPDLPRAREAAGTAASAPEPGESHPAAPEPTPAATPPPPPPPTASSDRAAPALGAGPSGGGAGSDTELAAPETPRSAQANEAPKASPLTMTKEAAAPAERSGSPAIPARPQSAQITKPPTTAQQTMPQEQEAAAPTQRGAPPAPQGTRQPAQTAQPSVPARDLPLSEPATATADRGSALETAEPAEPPAAGERPDSPTPRTAVPPTPETPEPERQASNRPEPAADNDSPDPEPAKLPESAAAAPANGAAARASSLPGRVGATPDSDGDATPPAPAASSPAEAAIPPPPPGSPAAPRAPVVTLPPARDQVNPDGTLIRPAPQGPLRRLQERLGR